MVNPSSSKKSHVSGRSGRPRLPKAEEACGCCVTAACGAKGRELGEEGSAQHVRPDRSVSAGVSDPNGEEDVQQC